jgi:2-polyprenyl-6-methoxyphenol hydroxylase-like FAD-dependent oxidoreductase
VSSRSAFRPLTPCDGLDAEVIDMQEHTGRAVVVGAGMAGLLAARVLSERFEQVTLVDRDDIALTPAERAAPRRGVPQGRHAHALLTKGQQVMEELLPGLRAELLAGGAPEGDALADFRLTFGGHRLPRARSGLRVISTSRAHLEGAVRQRVLSMPGVTVRAGCDAAGLVGDREGVRGLRVVDRAPDSAAGVLDADLVVEASGRASRLPHWLRDIGVPVSPPEQVAVALSYASCRFRMDPDVLDGDIGIICGPSATVPRTAALARLETGEWLLTVGGFGADRPPLDIPGLHAFVGTLPCGPELNRALRQGEPVSKPVPFRFPTATRYRYEHTGALPSGLLVLGDAACSQDPVYGQGMTVAALQARGLLADLRRGVGMAGVQPEVAAASRSAWQTARAADLALPGTPGRRSPAHRGATAYLARVQAAAAEDAAVAEGFLRVTGLIDPPSALLQPRILLPALGLRRPRVLPQFSDGHRIPQIGMTARLAAAALMAPTGAVVVLTCIGVALRKYLRAKSAR